MDDDDFDAHRQFRATMMVVMLAIVFGGGFFLFLIVITQGAILLVPVAIVGLGLFAGLHYLLWGRSMSKATEGERAEVEHERESDANEWDMPFPRHRRF